MIFQLEWCTYDILASYHFEGPGTSDEFKALCDRLIRESAEDAVQGKTRSEMHTSISWLGYDFFVEEVVARLADHGYKKVTFPEVTYTHGMILHEPEDDENGVLGEELLARVIAHNDKVQSELMEHRKAERNVS